MENYDNLSDMNDLGNSFKFNNNHAFDGFNKQENKKDESEQTSAITELEEETVEESSTPLVIDTKGRKVLTDWLNAEYTSAFQYKKVKLNYSSHTSLIDSENKNEIDIDDPIVVYEFIKKYTNILYDYNCDDETEKKIADTLEKELKEYFHKNSTKGIEEFLDKKFRELKDKYLIIRQNEFPKEKINKMLFIK